MLDDDGNPIRKKAKLDNESKLPKVKKADIKKKDTEVKGKEIEVKDTEVKDTEVKKARKQGWDTSRALPEYLLHNQLLLQYRAPIVAEKPNDGNEGDEPEVTHKKKRKAGDVGLAKQDKSTRLCKRISVGELCQYGDDCTFMHDVDEYLKTKPKDLAETCLFFDGTGSCPFGFKCRFGNAHIRRNSTTGKPELVTKTVENKKILEEVNQINSETLSKLRKYEYFSGQDLKDHLEVFTRYSKSMSTRKKKAIAKNPSLLQNHNTTALVVKEKKKLDLKNKIYIAPLTTVGNLPFRRITKMYGADITCGEMAMCPNLLTGGGSEWALMRRHPSEDVFGVQLAGGKHEMLGLTSKLLAADFDVDFIDINCGCPLDLVCNKGAGSLLMQKPKKLQKIVSYMSKLTENKIPIGIKIRTGWSDKLPSTKELVYDVQRNWCPEMPNLAYLAIHGRSRQARYTKTASWEYINSCLQSGAKAFNDNGKVNYLPILGNGDILSYEDWNKHLEYNKLVDEMNETLEANGQTGDAEYKLETCMIGRGALIKPWLCTEIKEQRHWDISSAERFDMLKEFVRFGFEHWGSDEFGVSHTRRFLLEWISFLHRYIPIALLEQHIPQHVNYAAPRFIGRDDMETLMGSGHAKDWIKIAEMLLGKAPDDFKFYPKHKANSAVQADVDL